MAEDRESTARWMVGISIAVAGIVISAFITLFAADRLGCPSWLCRVDQVQPSHVEDKPVLILDPASGPIGTRISVLLRGFSANETVTIRLGEVTIGSLKVDGQGVVDPSPITVPASFSAPAGRTTVTAFGQASHRTATADFTITAV